MMRTTSEIGLYSSCDFGLSKRNVSLAPAVGYSSVIDIGSGWSGSGLKSVDDRDDETQWPGQPRAPGNAADPERENRQGLYFVIRLLTMSSAAIRPSQASGTGLDGPATLRATTSSSAWGDRSRPSGPVPSSSSLDESDSGRTRCSATFLTTDVLRTLGGRSSFLGAGLRFENENELEEALGRDDEDDDAADAEEAFAGGRDRAGGATWTTVRVTTTAGFLGCVDCGRARTESGPPGVGFLVKRLMALGGCWRRGEGGGKVTVGRSCAS